MEFGRAWKDLKASFRGLVSTVFKDNVDKPKKTSAFVENLKGTVVQAHESLDDGPGPWDNMVPINKIVNNIHCVPHGNTNALRPGAFH